MATQFGATGSKGVFGITAAETGILADTATYAYSQESKVVRNVTGDTIGKTFYDERIEVSLSGFVPDSSAFTGTLAATITLVTAPTDYLKGSVGTITIVDSVTRSHTSEDFQKLDITAMNHPLITA
jgi:hypothetical protein